MEKHIWAKNKMLREFQEFISEHEHVLVLMGNLEKLKENILQSRSSKSTTSMSIVLIRNLRTVIQAD